MICSYCVLLFGFIITYIIYIARTRQPMDRGDEGLSSYIAPLLGCLRVWLLCEILPMIIPLRKGITSVELPPKKHPSEYKWWYHYPPWTPLYILLLEYKYGRMRTMILMLMLMLMSERGGRIRRVVVVVYHFLWQRL